MPSEHDLATSCSAAGLLQDLPTSSFSSYLDCENTVTPVGCSSLHRTAGRCSLHDMVEALAKISGPITLYKLIAWSTRSKHLLLSEMPACERTEEHKKGPGKGCAWS